MRLSTLFGQTLRETPASAEVASHALLLRAGFIRPLGSGIFTLLPLGLRVLQRIAAIMRSEMDRLGGQELLMPVVHPAEVWQESGRYQTIGLELGRFTDRSGRPMVLAMTHEEIVADLVRREVRSYRQLPRLLFHIQTKWRDDPRPRAGLIRTREFTMLDSYSLDVDEAGLDLQYRGHYQAYFNLFARCGLPVIAVQADVGMMGGSLAHEFMFLSPIGEDTIVRCPSCGYSANRQVARQMKTPAEAEVPGPLTRVATPGCATIEDLARFLDVPTTHTAKAVFFTAFRDERDGSTGQLVLALVRGDMEVNETKLAKAVGARMLRPATEDEVRAAGAVPGYASAIGLREARVVADDLLASSPNLVAGANEAGFHLRNVNLGRDFTPDTLADIAAAQEGSACPQCSAPMHAVRGVEVGNIFKLGTDYSDKLGCHFLDAQGSTHAVVMGSYGIGLGRLMACIAEAHHDEHGLAWPVSVAPYPVHLVVLAADDPRISQAGEAVERELQAENVEVLYDDRSESPGVKFADADLMGMPIRLTLGKRSMAQQAVELRLRHSGESRNVPLASLAGEVKREIARLTGELEAQRMVVPYP